MVRIQALLRVLLADVGQEGRAQILVVGVEIARAGQAVEKLRRAFDLGIEIPCRSQIGNLGKVALPASSIVVARSSKKREATSKAGISVARVTRIRRRERILMMQLLPLNRSSLRHHQLDRAACRPLRPVYADLVPEYSKA